MRWTCRHPPLPSKSLALLAIDRDFVDLFRSGRQYFADRRALGTYKPQIHTHYLPHLSLSFARHTSSLNTTFLLLSSDYSKSLHLQADRSLEFHTPQGCHYTTRLPRYGRDLKYDFRSAEALIPSVGVNANGSGEVFRLNLEAGRYMRGYEVDVGGDDFTTVGAGALQGGIGAGCINTAAVAKDTHNLLAFGTSIGTVEFWDPRTRGKVGILQRPAPDDLFEGKSAITALEFDRSGLGLAAGSSTGLIHLYDLRLSVPLLKKDQGYGYPIQTLIFLQPSISTRAQTSEPKILSADKRIIKIWNSSDASPWTSVEPAVDLHCVTWCKDTGMLLTANEGRQQHAFLIPQLGPAPKWCSFLDNLVEEMAEDPNDPNAFTNQRAGAIYDNYKFLTTQQLESLNLSHLIGTTTLLRPYMHGYFVAQRLYEEAKLIANPFIWEEERNKRTKAKIDAERESRIRGSKKVIAKVNRRLAERILERAEKNERRRAKRVLEKGGDDGMIDDIKAVSDDVAKEPAGLLADPRFAKLFQDEDYAIDEQSHEYLALHPSSVPGPESSRIATVRRLTAAEDEALSSPAGSSDSDSASDSANVTTALSRSPQKPSQQRLSTTSYRRSNHQPQLRVSSSAATKALPRQQDRSFGSRVAAREEMVKKKFVRIGVGEREITFAPRRKGKAGTHVEETREGPNKRRDGRSASGNALRRL